MVKAQSQLYVSADIKQSSGLCN